MNGQKLEETIRKPRTRYLPLPLVAAGVAVYVNSFSGVFLLDDYRSIVDNERVRRLWPIGEVVAHSPRPLVNLSLALNYAVSGLEVWSYHAFNLTVHVLAGLVLFGVVRRTLLREPFRRTHRQAAPWLALTVALIWAVHPLQTQSVTYLAQRGESMMGLFYLLTLYCVIRGEASPRAGRWYVVAVLACAAGMGSKAVMVTAPLVVLLYDRVFLSGSFAKALAQRWRLYVGLGATWSILGVLGIAQRVLVPPADSHTAVGFGYADVSPWTYALSQSGVILQYLKLSFWPSSLCLDYWWPVATDVRGVLPEALAVAALLLTTLWALGRRPRLGFVGAWFFLILAPTSSFIPIMDLAFEHRMYLPLAAVVAFAVLSGRAALAYVSARLSLKPPVPRGIAAGSVLVIVACLGHGTVERNKDYQSALKMWGDVLDKRPDNPRAHHTLSIILAEAGRTEEAIAHCTRAVELNPNDVGARVSLGLAHLRQGATEDAAKCFVEALQVKSDDAKAHSNLGIALKELGKLDQAIRHHRRALEIQPDFAEAHSNLGNALLAQGKLDEAIGHYRRALQTGPELADVHFNLGNALHVQGRHDGAIRHYRAALRLRPDNAETHYNLSSALLGKGNLDEAIGHYRRALRLKPDYAEAHYNLGLTLVMAGQVDGARMHFREALRLKPDWPAPAERLASIPATRPNTERREEDGPPREHEPTGPNILLITVESLRADHAGCYGYGRDTTPDIDALAAQGTVFEQAYSTTSWTLTSHASMFTGLYPSAHGVILPQGRLADAYTTCAELLSENGYQCAAVVGGPYLRKTFHLDQGFEYYDESVAASSNEEAHKDVTNPRMAAALERFLREARDPTRPFFLFAYYWDVHYDYVPPPPYDTMFVSETAERIESVQFGPIVALGRDISKAQLEYLIAQYDGEIRCTDEHLGRLWKLLRELDLWDNTAIILTADHGEQFFEHSYLGHKHDLYVESLHVPLIVKRAGQKQGARDPRVVNLLDLCPTILDLAGCRSAAPHHGRSLLKTPADRDTPTFFELTTTWDFTDRETGQTRRDNDRWVAVRSGRYKLLHVQDSKFWQLYDVVADPRERNPLGAEHESVAAELVGHLQRWRERMKQLSGLWERGPQAVLSPEEEARLRSLGYIQ